MRIINSERYHIATYILLMALENIKLCEQIKKMQTLSIRITQ